MHDLKALVNKTVDFRFRGADLRLDLSHALFSSFDVDVGTKLLFKAVGRDEVLARSARILDAGSGVGVIGLGVAAAFPGASVTLRDRDFLAVAFSERNRLRNRIANARVEAGLIGAGRIGGPWDYILSNVPAKAGGPVIAAFLAECRASLAPGGRLALVVVKPLVEEVTAALGRTGFAILSEERGAMHRSFVAAIPSSPPESPAVVSQGPAPQAAGEGAPTGFDFDLGAYRRRRGGFKLFGREYQATGFWGLPDFDTVGFPQVAATELLSRFASGSRPRRALVVNPGMGHAAIWLALAFRPETILLASRDLLSLLGARENLLALGLGPELRVEATSLLDLEGEVLAGKDLLVEFADPVPEHDWIGELWARALASLESGGTLVVATAPTELLRIEKRRPEGFGLLGEKRKKGSAAAAWRRF